MTLDVESGIKHQSIQFISQPKLPPSDFTVYMSVYKSRYFLFEPILLVVTLFLRMWGQLAEYVESQTLDQRGPGSSLSLGSGLC